MLYKKYHRNYMRQFKKGAKLSINKDEVTSRPFISLLVNCISVTIDYIERLILIDSNGRLLEK